MPTYRLSGLVLFASLVFPEERSYIVCLDIQHGAYIGGASIRPDLEFLQSADGAQGEDISNDTLPAVPY